LVKNVQTKPIGFELLPEEFTLSQLQNLYEVILEKSFDKRNFRKKINSMKLLIDTGKLQSSVSHRPAKLFTFDKDKYLKHKNSGFNFEI
jgi:8-oxo-dGTP diphosphatase